MQQDFYDTLGVPENADSLWIRRACETARTRIDGDASLSDAQRQAAQNELTRAFQTLSSPSLRVAYDTRLQERHRARLGATDGFPRAPVTWIVVAAAIVIGGALASQFQGEQQRLRLEKERVAAEQAAERRAAELEDRRLKEQQRLRDEIREQREAEEKQRQISMEARQADLQSKQFVADERYLTPTQRQYKNFAETVDMYQRQADAQRQRYEDASDLYRARAEAARQKRYVEQREREGSR